jgi:excinuclease ABC subunit C
MVSLKEKIANLPTAAGCYLYKNKVGKVVYVGKAKNLKRRVSSYFQKNHPDVKTRALVKIIVDLDFVVTDNEVEALLLEAKLIKQHQPPYNILLKEGQRYAYLKITEEKFPRLLTVRELIAGQRVFGPYVSGETRRQTVQLANSLFKLRVCKKMPKTPCLLYHIKQCSAPCIDKITVNEYAANIHKVELLLKGQTKKLIGNLQQEMKELASQQEYEQAKIRRDQLMVLQNLAERQKVSLPKDYDQDVLNYVVAGRELIIQLFNIWKGEISRRQEFRLLLKKNPFAEAGLSWQLASFVKQYYYQQEIPQEIILPENLPEQLAIRKYLSKVSGRAVRLTVPKQGIKKELLALVKNNLLLSANLGEPVLLELQNALQLPTLPRWIECFDISQIQGSNAVGSMVCFRDGRPDKNNYRHFIIKSVQGQNDFAMMKEIIQRRYSRLAREKSVWPDLILVDGGRPQLSAALQALRELGLALPVAALAKKEEELYTIGNQYPVRLSKKSAALKLVQRLRDQAHHFAISFHRQRRSRSFLTK